MGSKNFEAIKQYFETRPVVQKAVSYLKDGASIAFTIEGEEGRFCFVKRNGKGEVVEYYNGCKPDVELRITPGAIKKLVEFESDSIGEVGVLFLEILASHDPAVDIVIERINAGVFEFARKGYFRVLLAGGRPVMGFLARRGLGNLSAIKRAIERRRKSQKR